MLNFGSIDGFRSLNRSRSLILECFGAGSGYKIFGTGAESESQDVTPATTNARNTILQCRVHL